ncbi:hypothetical protein CDAR_6961 [Caerostris darwini]|uniref:Uncharacterized protein n=1 Tax=Caerostris darwini TaxID=1538125 RepID=A0AAV4PFC0_9ARAC|nr:hypothetical protein CDAR_6961 [Caerostris darwini]
MVIPSATLVLGDKLYNQKYPIAGGAGVIRNAHTKERSSRDISSLSMERFVFLLQEIPSIKTMKKLFPDLSTRGVCSRDVNLTFGLKSRNVLQC